MLPISALAGPAGTTPALPATLPPAATQAPTGTLDRLGALLQVVESRHMSAHQQVVRELAGAAGTSVSPAAMLRLQAAVGEFGVRVQLSVRLAEDLSRSVQTLTQRT